MSARRKLSDRAQRRADARANDKLVRDRERLARLSPGGSPELPIEVQSASQIEPHATSLPCLRCEQGVRVDEHRAEVVGAARLRAVRTVCIRCGASRELWFRIVGAMPN